MTTAAVIGRTLAESGPAWSARPTPPVGAPNIVVIVLDDVGYGQLGCFGGDIATPTFDRLATNGLRFGRFQSSALCSPTRAALLTGRNPHSVGYGTVAERASGFPGYDARIPPSAATLATTLRDTGYSTWALGKWHNVPAHETGPAGPFDSWPLGKGFERFYGFVGGSTDQYHPSLVRDNTRAPIPDRHGYHLTEDLADQAVSWVRERAAVSPDKPFLLYLATGAGHAPHQVPPEWIAPYHGAFDDGWQAARHRTFDRQRRLGLFGADTPLAPDNPGVQDWSGLSDAERRVYARMMEVYAGFITHTDHHIGRLVDELERTGDLDNTLLFVVSDNGASADGGPNGTLSEGLFHNDLPQRLDDAVAHLDELGGPRHYNNYPWGWAQAGNTPFRWYKHFTHAGGITVPLIVHWPRRIADPGGIRQQYHHVIDVLPTILDATGVAAPDVVAGVAQQPIEGASMLAAFTDPGAPQRTRQYYEVYGNRGMWHEGLMAVSRLQPDAPGDWPAASWQGSVEDLTWELYDLRADPTQTTDLAADRPADVARLDALWWDDAAGHQVLPLDLRMRHDRWDPQPDPPGAHPQRFVFHGPCGPLERGASPRLTGAAFTITADVDVPSNGAHGVLIAIGNTHGGYVWHLTPHEIVFEINLMVEHQRLAAPLVLDEGHHTLRLEYTGANTAEPALQFYADGTPLGGGIVDRMLKIYPAGAGRTQIGADHAPTVSDSYTAPNAFTGQLHRLTVAVGGEHQAVNETAAALSTQ